jgi:hypothetical protein
VTGELVEPLPGCLAVDTGAAGRWGLAAASGAAGAGPAEPGGLAGLAGLSVGDRVEVTGRPTRPEAAHPAWPGPTLAVLSARRVEG